MNLQGYGDPSYMSRYVTFSCFKSQTVVNKIIYLYFAKISYIFYTVLEREYIKSCSNIESLQLHLELAKAK